MNKIVIIPLGGFGMRFKNANYSLPKPLINVMGKPIIYWLLENLNLHNIEFVYIPYNKELKKYRFEDQLIKDFPNINFIFYCLEINTRGTAETIQLALNYLKKSVYDNKHVICIDGDNFYTIDILEKWNGENMIMTFEDYFEDPIFSYIKTNNNIVTDIKEKNKISNNACCGVYAFASLNMLLENCNYIINNNTTDISNNNYFYLSVVIKNMINTQNTFYEHKINKNNYFCLGTPLQIKIFCNNFTKFSQIYKIKQKRYCFDLDNTLVTFPKIKNDYTSVEPIKQNIDMVKYLKKIGHTIIIYTARKMNTYNSNTGKVLANVGKITFDTLEKFDIPYDEIYFGKPHADYYIDDLAISSYDDLEKILGYHQTNIDPRDHNTIEKTEFEIIKKISSNLNGEIYYYKNIPPSIKYLFPIFINYDINNTWYQMEKINGITISKIYLSGEMTTNLLKNILDNIKIIQNTPNTQNTQNTQNINIYSNYSKKIKERYASYDYSQFVDNKKIYDYLIKNLDIYENNNEGKITIIHGDAVFTNIIIDQYNKLKFIDMRGKIGDELTICGDWLYDWSKIYQSLIGYDEILCEVNLDLSYKNNLITYFENYFLESNTQKDLQNLKLITKSLLFTLLPLHHNEKCKLYYNLIFNIL